MGCQHFTTGAHEKTCGSTRYNNTGETYAFSHVDHLENVGPGAHHR